MKDEKMDYSCPELEIAEFGIFASGLSGGGDGETIEPGGE